MDRGKKAENDGTMEKGEGTLVDVLYRQKELCSVATMRNRRFFPCVYAIGHKYINAALMPVKFCLRILRI